VRAFGVSQTMDGLHDTPMRAVFLADADGTVRSAHLYEADEVPDVAVLLAEARALGAA